MARIKAALNVAIRWELLDKNPFKLVKWAIVNEMTRPSFTKDEFRTLLSSIDEVWFREVVIFAAMTGMRRGEIVDLRWIDVNLEKRTTRIQRSPTLRTKQGKTKVLPMNDVVFHLLESKKLAKESEIDFVFTLNGGKIYEDWIGHRFRECLKRVNLDQKGLRFHSLRHNFASWLVQDGVSLYEVQKLLGHSSTKVTEVYLHLQPEMRHDTVNRIHLD